MNYVPYIQFPEKNAEHTQFYCEFFFCNLWTLFFFFQTNVLHVILSKIALAYTDKKGFIEILWCVEGTSTMAL